jgi:hypothetical protein
MQETFFDIPNPSADAENRLRIAMADQWKNDLEVVSKRGVIPDWIGEPKPLSKDKAAFMDIVHNNSYVLWTKTPSKNNKDIARAMGYVDRERGDAYDIFGEKPRVDIIVSAKAAIDALVRESLVKGVNVEGGIEYELTMNGEYALREWHIDRELGIL